jgi:hypothetical protein
MSSPLPTKIDPSTNRIKLYITPVDDYKFTLPLHEDGTYDFTVNWGDGSAIATITSYDDEDISHTYLNATPKIIVIIGQCTILDFNQAPDLIHWDSPVGFSSNYLVGDRITLDNGDIYECILEEEHRPENEPTTGANWETYFVYVGHDLSKKMITRVGDVVGTVGLTKLNFGDCTNLITLDSTMANLSALTNYTKMFYNCKSLEYIPKRLFKYYTGADFTETFSRCSRLKSIPEDLFKYNIDAINFVGVFSGCTGLTSIPEDLFKYNTLAEDFNTIFSECTSLTSIPVNIFKYNINARIFYNAFSDCTGLTEIPEHLLDTLVLAEDFAGLFFNCENITSIPEELFKYNTEVWDLSNVFYNTGIVSINENIFKYNTKVTTFGGSFSCTKITSIPANLFKYNIIVNDFWGVFCVCPDLTTIPADIFKYNTEVEYFDSAFGNSGITSLPTDLFRYNTKALSFGYAFIQCYDLATLPEGLFKYNTLATNFEQALSYGKKLQVNARIFCDEGDEDTRFLNQEVIFTNCFHDNADWTGIQGEAPDLWNYDFGTATPIKTDCFSGWQVAARFSNAASIPEAWK